MIQTINVMEVHQKEILFPGEPSILLLTYPFEEYLFDLPHTSHGEKTLRVQDGSMDLFSGSPLQLIFWKLPAVEFGCCIKEKYQLSKKKKRLFTYSSFSNCTSVRGQIINFKWNNISQEIVEAERIQLSSLSQTWKIFTEI